jgi:hypothetical protein
VLARIASEALDVTLLFAERGTPSLTGTVFTNEILTFITVPLTWNAVSIPAE